jgi:WD40 repeat protein
LFTYPSETGVRRLEGHTDAVFSVAFSHDGTQLATGSSDMTARIWNVSTWACESVLTGHSDGVRSVAFCPDGLRLATASNDKTIRIYEVFSGRHLRTFDGIGSVNYIAISLDGSQLVSGSADNDVNLWDMGFLTQKSLRLWNLSSMAHQRTLKGHSSNVHCVAFHPDCSILASASSDNTVRLWSSSSGDQCLDLAHDTPVFSVCFSPDGSHLASETDLEIWIWNLLSRKTVLKLQGREKRPSSISFSPDSKFISSGSYDSNMALVWHVAD